MSVSCGNYLCENDVITFDDLNENECIGIKENVCTSCETVHAMIKANPGEFYKNPAKILFDVSLSESNLKILWDDLQKYCGVKYLVLAKENIEFIAPEIDQASSNYESILTYLNAKHNGSKYTTYLSSLYEIVKLSDEITMNISSIETSGQKETYEKILRQKMSKILEDGGWNCLLVHHPLELPYIIGLILKAIADKPHKLDVFMKYVDLNPNACAEAEFDLLYQKIS